MNLFPLVYVKNRKIVDGEGKRIDNWKERLDRYHEIYIIDLDGIERNEPNLDLYRGIYKKKWIDSFPRRFEDVMDTVVAGGDRIVIRDGFDRGDVERLFESLDVEFYLSICRGSKLRDYRWHGFVYLLDRDMNFDAKELLYGLSNVFIIAKHKEFIDFDWVDENDVVGISYPLWEMGL